MTDPSKIYNDAPDEFAEFLDSGEHLVSLKKLGGIKNPFIKAGIYKPERPDDLFSFHTICPSCGCEAYGTLSYDLTDTVDFKCGCLTCLHEFKLEASECTYYEIDHAALAEFVSKGIGCLVCRQFQKTGWLFGTLRGYNVYFACSPTKGMYRALTTSDKSVLIIGKNNPKLLPEELGQKVILLARLLFVKDGELHFAQEAIEEKIPPSRRKASTETKPASSTPIKRFRPPIQIYTPYYLAMVKAWISQLRANHGKYERPPMKWMQAWMYENGPFEGKRLCERQMYRHIEAMTAETSNDKIDKRNPIFTMFYNGCESMSFVENFFEKDLVAEIQKTMQRATKIPGFRLRPMRTCDAAEIARTA